MKQIIIALAVAGTLFTACKKNDTPPVEKEKSQFKIGDSSYTTTDIAISGDKAVQATNYSVTFGALFSDTLPSSSGTYTIVRNLPAPGEIQVFGFTTSPNKSYYSTGLDNAVATVHVDAEKLTVTVPEIWGKHEMDDSVRMSGKIVYYFSDL